MFASFFAIIVYFKKILDISLVNSIHLKPAGWIFIFFKEDQMKSILQYRWVLAMTLALTLLVMGNFVHAAKLRVGVDTAFVPFEFKGPDGKYTGFDVDL